MKYTTMGGTAARFYLDPFGCAKNQVDAEVIITSLIKSGYIHVETEEEADIIIVNSCGFIESAKKEAINAVIDHKNNYPEKKILLAGCLAQRYKHELAETLTEADGIFGNAAPERIHEAIEAILKDERKTIIPEQKSLEREYIREKFLSFKGNAYVKITEGCSNNCTFCAIPIIRGVLKSRHIEDIISEITILLSKGMKEINLVGQDSGSYGIDLVQKPLITDLLAQISAIKGDFRVRVLYIHPDHFPMNIFPIMQKDPRIIPYFDIPFQHASPKILSAMNRKGTSEIYLSLIKTIRKELPNAILRSTFLTGFPGETHEDHRLLLDFIAKAELDWAGSFTYSREDGTIDYDLKGKVPKKISLERKKEIEQIQQEITLKHLDQFVGNIYDCLIEEKVEGENLYIGRIYSQAPEVDGLTVISSENLEPGTMVPVKIYKTNFVDLEAVPIE